MTWAIERTHGDPPVLVLDDRLRVPLAPGWLVTNRGATSYAAEDEWEEVPGWPGRPATDLTLRHRTEEWTFHFDRTRLDVDRIEDVDGALVVRRI